MKLNSYTLSLLNTSVSLPTYSKSELRTGIVHIGVGGFHRAHQAVYTDTLLNEEACFDWAICGIGLRAPDRQMEAVLSNQDFYYSVIELGYTNSKKVKVIGSINEFIFAPDAPQLAVEKLASYETRIVSLTITEGGYNVSDDTGEFNVDHPDVIHDLAYPMSPKTVFGLLTEALDIRKRKGIPPFTVMSCDNLPSNGDVARHALITFARQRDPSLSEWIDKNVSFPNSMVDRITPQTDKSHIDWLEQAFHLHDQWPVVCEPFSQWVLEDDFCFGRPPWEKVGVTFTSDVRSHELVKIRLLNASHMAMAYLGFLTGFRYTHDVISDPTFFQFIQDFMDEDVSPLLIDIKDIDIEKYKESLMQRFSNKQIADQVARLCLDGSSKMPKFIIPTILSLILKNRPLDRVALIIAGWAHYLKGKDELGEEYAIKDPLYDRLQEAVRNRETLTQHFLGLQNIFTSALLNSQEFVSAFEAALIKIESQGVKKAIRSLGSKD